MNEKIVQRMKLLGFPLRAKIFELLCEREYTHAELSSALQTFFGVWEHLQKMVNAGLLIKIEVERRDIRYRANPQAIEEMVSTLKKLQSVIHLGDE